MGPAARVVLGQRNIMANAASLPEAYAQGRAFNKQQRRVETTLALLRVLNVTILTSTLWWSEALTVQHELALSLGGYGGIALLGLALALIGFYRPWLPWALVTAEAALIAHCLGMIAASSGHTPETALSAPGAATVYLILAQSAVRRRPWLVLYTAALFVGIWLTLSRTPFLFSDGPSLKAQLQGALSDALSLVIFSLTAITLFVAVRHARQHLLNSISERELRNALGRFLPAPLVKRMERDGGRAQEGRVQELAVMMIDIRGFTGIAEQLPPDRLVQLLASFRSFVGRAIERQGGTIDKFIGDAVLAVFGLDGKQAADHAVRCALQIIEQLENWNKTAATGLPSLSLSIGIHYGPALVAIVESEGRREFTVLGDTVNVAARVQQLCSQVPYDLIISEDVVAACRDAFESQAWRLLAERRLRGRTKEVALYAFLKERPTAGVCQELVKAHHPS